MRLLALLAACAVLPSVARAQCADGSPPPCPQRRPAAVPQAPVIDANKVAILPFRVTTSDTLLGEGFAELLAGEFTGQGMPRSVDMGTALQVWRQAGGRSRTALTRAQTLQVARALGAGLVSEGSIVGLGRQITISAVLLGVPDGRERGSSARVTVAADSLDYGLRRVAAILTATANSSGSVTVTDDVRFTRSPEALRDYLEGMAHWRSGRLRQAAAAWDRAIERDSTFARAMFRRLVAQGWAVPGRITPRQVFAVRDRLSDAERIVLEGTYGKDIGEQRSVEQRFADRARAVMLLPDNADALYTAGDGMYHAGAAIDPTGHIRQAVELLSRAAAIDSQATVLQHLLEAALRLRDTALMRRVAPAFHRADGGSRWQLSWLTAAHLGDERWLSRLRAEPPRGGGSVVSPFLLDMITGAPGRLRDEMYDRWLRVADSAMRNTILGTRAFALMAQGRPAAADSLWGVASYDDRAAMNRFMLGLAASGVPLPNQAAIEARLQAETTTDSASVVSRRCVLTAALLARGVAAPVDTTGFDRHARGCALLVAILRLPLDGGAATELALGQLDSLVRFRSVISVALDGYEAAALARAWEKFGNPARALRAIRYRNVGNGPAEAPWNYPEEGRLAALMGDTTGARRAYTMWLEITQDAEPLYEGKRAEVRAALARLSRSPVP